MYGNHHESFAGEIKPEEGGERESALRDVEDDFHLKESQSASWQMSPWRRLVSVKKLLSLLLMYTLIWMIFFFFSLKGEKKGRNKSF